MISGNPALGADLLVFGIEDIKQTCTIGGSPVCKSTMPCVSLHTNLILFSCDAAISCMADLDSKKFILTYSGLAGTKGVSE